VQPQFAFQEPHAIAEVDAAAVNVAVAIDLVEAVPHFKRIRDRIAARLLHLVGPVGRRSHDGLRVQKRGDAEQAQAKQ
jgi:hypothetical protein